MASTNSLPVYRRAEASLLGIHSSAKITRVSANCLLHCSYIAAAEAVRHEVIMVRQIWWARVEGRQKVVVYVVWVRQESVVRFRTQYLSKK